MMYDFKYLLSQSSTDIFQTWVKNRLEALSVREEYILASVLQRSPPKDIDDLVYCLYYVKEHDICPAGTYEALGKFYFQRLKVSEDVLPYVDLDQLGHQYADEHPGQFIGQYYVVYPKEAELMDPVLTPYEDEGWSVKLKLASSAVPDGVWLRLPDYGLDTEYGIGELALALRELKVDSLDDCTLLDAQCILPGAGDLMAQYSSVSELVSDGNNLGHILEDQDQNELFWLVKIFDILQYEDCHTLKFAMDIIQNLHCYEWVPRDELEKIAINHLQEKRVPDELIKSGTIDLKDYAGELLELSGYKQVSDKPCYITRNNLEFIREYTAPSGAGMTMQ